MAKAGAGFHQCVTAVQNAAGRELREEEIERIFSRVQGAARRYEGTGMSRIDALVRAGRELGDEMRLAGVIEKRNKIINAMRRREVEGQLVPGKEAADLRRVILQADAQQAGVTAELMGPLAAKLRETGLDKLLARGDATFERDVWRELGAVHAGQRAATANAQARQAAEIIADFQERARVMQNQAGAWIGKREDYITRQMHETDKVRKAGFEAWRDFILPRLDERTFDSLDDVTPDEVEKFLRRVYRALASGVHDKPGGRVAWGDVGAGTGPANLAKRLSENRTLVFKDADARADYHAEFGRGSLMNVVAASMESAARNTALLRVWGPNPEAMFDTISEAAKRRARDADDFKAVDALNDQTNSRIFDVITGKSAVPENLTWAQIGAWGAALQTTTKLGGVVLASVPDLAVNAASLRHNGIPLFESYGNQIRALLPKSAGRKETALLAGAGFDSVMGGVAARFHAMEVGRGVPAKLVDTFHKLNLLQWWTDSLKGGVATTLTHNMGRYANVAFDALDPALRGTMSRYGITAADWDVARAFAGKAPDGRLHMLPAMIEDAKVRSKFFTYVADQVRDAMTEPDAYVRQMVTWGTQNGTALGTAVRLLMQFKTYPVTFMRRTWQREFNGQNGMDVAGIAHLVVATTFLGYAAMELKNIARGRDPRTANADKPTDYVKLVFAAMQQGGGFGLYGDFLFGDKSRMGAGPVTSLFGPTVGTADALIREVQQLRKWILEGDARAGKDARSGALGLVRDNFPFINMFYSRAVLDYFLWYRMQEALNPGYLARYEQRMRQENDTTFMISPTVSPYR